MTVFGEWSFLVLSTHEIFIVFSLPCLAGKRSDKAALVAAGHPVGVKPLRIKKYNLIYDFARSLHEESLWFLCKNHI